MRWLSVTGIWSGNTGRNGLDVNYMNMKTRIVKLQRPEHCGDWHDKPLRWAVWFGFELQKFETRANARLYAGIRRRCSTEQEAHVAYVLA
jgi:hypothetical protein